MLVVEQLWFHFSKSLSKKRQSATFITGWLLIDGEGSLIETLFMAG